MIKKVSLLAINLLASQAFAMNLIPNQSSFYYRIGGGSDHPIPHVKKDTQVVISGDIKSRLDFVCAFNPMVSLSNSLNEIKNAVNGVPEQVYTNLKIGAMSYPAYKLSQSAPTFYNIIQNENIHGQEIFNLSMKDCNDIRRDIRNGASPYEDFFKISDSQGWLDAAKQDKEKHDSVDINKRKIDIANNRETYGIPWVHPGINSGGTEGNQVPIKVISDVVIAGYNVLISPSRALDSKVRPPADSNANFLHFWPSPEDASNWATMVLGDVNVSLSERNDDRENKAGVGLSALIESCPKIGQNSNTCLVNVSSHLWNLVKGKTQPNPQNLRPISASSLVITEEVIDTIKKMDAEMQIITVSKLSQEIAVQNLLDEALMLRHILQAGFQTQPVQNLEPARRMVKNALNQLDSEIKALSFEHQVRKQMLTSTLNTIVSIREANIAKSMTNNQVTTPVIKNGGVYKAGETTQ